VRAAGGGREGLSTRVLQSGTGTATPSDEARVLMHYTGWTTDGELFDSPVQRGRPATLALTGVIAGFAEALGMMVEGETRRMWIPQELAYKGVPGRPEGTLVFDVQPLEILEPPRAPAELIQPPPAAQVTASGLTTLVLRPGTGLVHPRAAATVTVHYSGWTTDGTMIDSSATRGRPASFPLDRVIPGWTEGLQLMVVGEKRRLWIPEELAYQGRPSGPQGDLVFDVELLAVEGH